jgi:phospholipid-binding lipoprotein MlaA
MRVSTTLKGKIATLALIAVLCGGMTACAKSQDPKVALKTTEISDPIEPVNRAVFAFNNFLDMILIEPVAKIYNAVFPGFVRDGVQNFMHNLRSPLIIANNVLQGDIGDAGVATARFIINTTAGVAGLVDVAATQGMAYEEEDFGQTLAVWGLGNGFYIMLPVLGPTSLRDGTGRIVDALADPVRIVAHSSENDWIYYTRNAVEGLDNRARLVKALADLRKNSLDYYAAIRSAYAQKRASLVRDETPDALQDIPDYDEQY